MLQSDEARKLMDEMMKVTIFQPSEKRQMLEDETKTPLDPNLIMDARHRIVREDVISSPTKSVLAERLLTQEINRQHLKRNQAFIEKELRKFEEDLQRSRPKFCEPYTCSRKNIARSDDENFWKTSRKIKVLANKKRMRTNNRKTVVIQKEMKQACAEALIIESLNEDCKQSSINDIENSSFSNIKVTIKDKSNSALEEQRLQRLRSCFKAFQENARDKRRLREIKMNIQNIASRKNLKSCIRTWKLYVENAKKTQQECTMKTKDPDERKIEILINTITETQRELAKCPKTESQEYHPNSINIKNNEVMKKIITKPFIVESPAQNRLNAQKEIIRQQKIKLAEQSKIIEELKLKQVQEEITKANEETMNAAKETLTRCAQQTKRNLIQLLRQAGYRDKSLTTPLQVPSPPRFLLRTEARAEARRNRIKIREEIRRKKLEEEKRKEYVIRREEEQERRRLQQEVLREAKKMREEQEQQRAYEIERCKKLNAVAEAFYRKYLLRHYVMEPFITLVEMRNNYIKKADNHYKWHLLQKAFVRWQMEVKRQIQINIELAISVYNSNLLWCAWHRWKEMIKEEKKKEQVANDFSDMKLQNKCFKMWKIKCIQYRTERLKNEHLALEHYEKSLKIKYFNMWIKYSKLIPDIMESERIRNTWRELVQELVPDFNPRQRGVILED